MKRGVIFAVLVCGLAQAAELVLPGPALEREGTARVAFRTRSQATGKGSLAVRWTDGLGRLVDDRKIPVELTDESEFAFAIDLSRAAAIRNELAAHFSFVGKNQKGEPDRREEDAAASFIARPAAREWWDYVVLMWQPYNADAFALLKTLGINAGQYNGKSRTPPEFLLKNDLRWYAENIATDWYAEYHRWRPDRIQNWSFLQAKELYKQDPAGKEAFKRKPSLSDPGWRERIRARLIESARYHSPYRPVFYDLADESGIADLAAFWDFDFSDQSLAEMREWLKTRYPTLAELNRQWGTQFATWDLVVPDTTNEAMKRPGENFSAWADHKEWMDISFARALKMGNDAVRSVDPEAYVGIGGAQMPGWGGYDYWRISQAVTALEPYNIGNNIEIVRSLNPRVAVVTTAFARGPWEKQRVWYELLHGSRGHLIWDDKNEFVTRQGAVGDRGREVQPYYTELRGGIATLLMNSARQADRVAIHYSQASMRTEWMLARRPDGDAWVRRGSAIERRDSEFLRVRESWCRLVEDLGLQYNFVAYEQVEQGELMRGGYRVLILPRSSSLSEPEARAIREFAAQGGLVIADGVPGTFDEHSRRRDRPALEGVSGLASMGAINYHQQRLTGKEQAARAQAAKLFEQHGVRPRYVVTDATGAPVTGVETHSFRNGAWDIVALLTNPQLRVDELGPPEFKSNERFEKPQTLRLALPCELYVYDVRAGKALGSNKEVRLTLDPYEPAIYALAAEAPAGMRATVPAAVRRGETAVVGLTAGGPATHVFHVEVRDPSGKLLPHYSRNVLAPAGRSAARIPMAMNDPAGEWGIAARNVMTGERKNMTLRVDP